MTEEQKIELLVRYSDDAISAEEHRVVSDLLEHDAEARGLLRAIAEQAVELADLERTVVERNTALNGSRPTGPPARSENESGIIRLHALKWALPLAAMIVLLFSAVVISLKTPQTDSSVAIIRGMGTAIEWTGPDGKLVHGLKRGDSLAAGMDVRTLAGDGWLWLELNDGSEVIVTAHSKLTAFEDRTGQVNIRFQEGDLWGNAKEGTLPVSTPTADFLTTEGVFHIESSQTMSVLQVYEGAVGVIRSSDKQAVDIAANHQVTISMNNPRRLIAKEQPEPVNFWNCGMLESPQAVMGNWARPAGSRHARLQAIPYQLKREDGSTSMLHVTKFNVASSGSPSVLLETDSVLRVHGRTSGVAKIRFGVTTQKLRGLYTGRYRTIVTNELDRDDTGAWSIELPIAKMGLLDDDKRFSKSPIGAELRNILIYTMDDDIDLEIQRVELLPRSGSN